MKKQTAARLLNTTLFVAVALIGYGLTVYLDNSAPPARAKIEKENSEAIADFSFTDLAGSTHNLEDFEGKIVIINFWATWCAPCVVEFPALLDLAAKNKSDVVLIALSSDMDEAPIRNFLKKQQTPGANVYIAHDSENLTLKQFGVSQLPETIITDRALKKRTKLIGAEWSSTEVQKIIDAL